METLHATRIRTTARRLDITITPEKRVVVLTGANGAGKSTVLNSLIAGSTGTLLQAGKQIAAPQLVYKALMDGPGDFRVRIEYEGGAFVDRKITGADDGEGGVKVSTVVKSSFANGLTGKAADGAVIAAIGNPALFDVQAFLALAPGERKTRLLSTCASMMTPWSAAEVMAAVERHVLALCGGAGELAAKAQAAAWGLQAESPDGDPEDFFALNDDETFYDALVRHVQAAAKRLKLNSTEIERLQRAIERLDQDAAGRTQTVHGTVEHWDQQIERLGKEIEGLQRDLGRAEQSAERRKSIEGEIARLRTLAERPVQAFEQAVAEAQAGLERVVAALEEAEASADPVFTPNSELPGLVAERDEAQTELSEVLTRELVAQQERNALQAVIDTLTAPHEGEHDAAQCPTCRQGIDAEHLESLRGMVQAANERIAAMQPEKSRLQTAVRYANTDIKEVEEEDAARKLAVAREAESLAQRRIHLRADAAPDGTAVQAVALAERALAERQAVEERLDALEREKVELGTEDPVTLRQQAQGAEQQRIEARRNRSMVAEADERRRTRLRAVADREAAEACVLPLTKGAAAWEAVLHEFGLQAVAPFVTTINRMAPAGWTFDTEIATGTVRVARPGRPPIPLVNLSDGEASMLFPAMSVAFAKASGARWRCVLGDRAEAMQSGPAPGAPHGLFVRFIEGLQAAVTAGEIDQAFIATARLTPDEARAVVAAGAQIVRLGEPEPDTSRDTVKTAVDELNAVGVRQLYEWIGAPEEGSLPVARAMAYDRAVAAGKNPADIIAICETLPKRARPTTPGGANHTEEATP